MHKTRIRMRVAIQSVCVTKILALQRWSKIDFPPEQSVTYRYREFPVPGIFYFFGGIGTGIGKHWYRKKVSEPVSEKFGTGKRWRWRWRLLSGSPECESSAPSGLPWEIEKYCNFGSSTFDEDHDVDQDDHGFDDDHVSMMKLCCCWWFVWFRRECWGALRTPSRNQNILKLQLLNIRWWSLGLSRILSFHDYNLLLMMIPYTDHPSHPPTHL